MMFSKWSLIGTESEPAFSMEPHQTRMATCYRDDAGTYHLFADHMTTQTISWNADIRYYRSRDLRQWEFVDTAVPRGGQDDADAFGASSPHVLAVDGRVLLFYGGSAMPEGGFCDAYALPGEKGYFARRLMLATARADAQGAPAGPFTKQGVIVDVGPSWDAMRLDDPCAVPDGDTVHLYYKAFDTNRDLGHVVVGYARAALGDLRFAKRPHPVLRVEGGGEMPRVFRYGDEWHMFYRHFGAELDGGTLWRHYVSPDGLAWTQADSHFFDGGPGGGPPDLMMIYGMNGSLTRPLRMLAAGSENGINKLWSYRLVPGGG